MSHGALSKLWGGNLEGGVGVVIFPGGLALMYTISTVASTVRKKNKTDLHYLLDCTLPSSKRLASSGKYHVKNANAAIYSLHLSALVLPCQSLLHPLLYPQSFTFCQERSGPQVHD